MSYPLLYSATERSFGHNGIGILGDCISCDVIEEANGMFELSMLYPMDGIHFDKIAERSIIKAKPDQTRKPQLFRVYSISKTMNGVVSVSAEHISYELSGIPVAPFSAFDAASALRGLKENSVVPCPFEFLTDNTTIAGFEVKVPSSIRSRLGGVAGSILDVYGGEYEFDNYTVKLHKNRGMNRGVSVRYGKNLTDIKQEHHCSNVYSGVYPYWAGEINGETIFVSLPEKIINAPGKYDFVKIKMLDMTNQFSEKPTVEDLRDAATTYVSNNNIGVPDVSLSVSFTQMEQIKDTGEMNLLERVGLFDTVNVQFPALNVSTTAKVTKVVYDVLADRIKTAFLGSVRANIADVIAGQQQAIEKNKKSGIDIDTLVVRRLESSLENGEKMVAGGASILFSDDLGNAASLSQHGVDYYMESFSDGYNQYPNCGMHLNPLSGWLGNNGVSRAQLWKYDIAQDKYYTEMEEYRWVTRDGEESEIGNRCHFEYISSIDRTVLVRDD